MSKKKKKHKHTKGSEGSESSGPLKFRFGDPEPVLDGSHIYDYAGVDLLDNGQYYMPPVPLSGMARLLRANAYHGPLIEFKVNMLTRDFIGCSALGMRDFQPAVTDYNVFANAYFQKIYNYYGQVVALRHLAAINMRRLKEVDCYGYLEVDGKLTEFRRGEVLHIKNYDVLQSIYGVPYYLGAIQSMLLNEDATLFRRKYYKNGAHMGYIFYSSNSAIAPDDQERLKKAIEGSKGVGNFRNMFLHIPNGREKDIQILPVGDFSTRDELATIKNLSRDDIIAAHRIPPAMANIIPTNTGGFGDIAKIDAIYFKNEITPLQQLFLTVNNALTPEVHIGFKKDEITEDKAL